MKRIEINTENAPQAIGPYAQAVKTDLYIFTSGQIAISPETGKMIEGGIEEETEQVLKNLSNVLKASGSSLEKVVKATVFLDDLKNFESMNKVYSKYFKDNKPARSCVEVKALPKGAKIEIELIALSS